MERRDMMKLLATMPLGAWALSGSEVADAATHTHAVLEALEGRQALQDNRLVGLLGDVLEVAGPHRDEGVAHRRAGLGGRAGLGWINAESRSRFGVPFPDATAAQRLAIVDDIAWPAKATKAHQSGVRFFNAFRDLTASGFFTSRIGVKDIGYMGNMPLSAGFAVGRRES